MTSVDATALPPLRPEAMLAGPRGRRFLLDYALRSAEATDQEHGAALGLAVMTEGHHLDTSGGRVVFGPGADELLRTRVPHTEVARLIDETALLDPTPELLRASLAEAVEEARYWQPPAGEDLLVAAPPVRDSLARVAQHIAASPHAHGFTAAVDPAQQWAAGWNDDPPVTRADEALLPAWRARYVQAEEEARREQARHPYALVSGAWWSSPPLELPSTGRTLPDGSPSGLWFVEDDFGEERATARRIEVAPNARVFEVTGAGAWARLCARFPLDVSAQMRADWSHTTSRDGAWVMPDWSSVAQTYDGVHLNIAGYFAAAGTAIEVGDGRASVIAGINPDETTWLRDVVRGVGEPVHWLLETAHPEPYWSRDQRP